MTEDFDQQTGHRPKDSKALRGRVPLPVRVVSWIVVVAQLAIPCNSTVWAGAQVLLADAGVAGGTAVAGEAGPAPVLPRPSAAFV